VSTLLNDSSLKELLSLCYTSTGVFGKTFSPDAFSSPFSSLHNQMLELIDSPRQFIAIAAPRGLGKTTTVSELAKKSILYRDYEFICYVSNSETVATMQTENIKRDLRTNYELKKVFGDITISTDDPDIDESFSKASWVAFGNTLVMPRGANQQIRGLRFKRFRPQLIIIDDLEKKEELENPENRRKLKQWFYSDLMKCVDRYSNKFKLIYIDTLKHEDSLLAELLTAPNWHSITLELCGDDYTSNVPDLISTEEILIEAEAHRASGQLDVFFMEYRNLPTAKETAAFKQEYFQYYEEAEIKPEEYENVIIVDPAKTPNMNSADSAIVGIGINYWKNEILIRDLECGKWYPDELYDRTFAMRRRLNAHAVGIEVTGLEEFIKQPIINEMQKRGPSDMFEPIWLKARGGDPSGEKGKIKRIGSLVPYYRYGYIKHNKRVCATLESQLLAFPRGKRVDCADATAYIIEMLELGERYFSTPPENDHRPNHEDEFAELENETPLENWERI
jgi:hypothetical protein